MRGLVRLFSILFTLTMAAVPASARTGERKAVASRIIRLKLSLLIPGQTDIGMKEVEIKLNHFLKDFDLTLEQFLKLRHQDPANEKVQKVLSSVNFSRFLSKRNIQVVRDPLGRFQMFDGHHLAMTLTLLEIESVDVELHEDFWVPDNARSRRTLETRRAKYHAYMIKHNLVRLIDRLGRTIDFTQLPEMPSEMKNNPFRSLAWILKKIGVFEDLILPMQEFEWATLLQKEFRKRGWELNFHSNAEFMTAVKRAIKALGEVEEDVIAKLPGYLTIPNKSKRRHTYKADKLERCERLLYEFET